MWHNNFSYRLDSWANLRRQVQNLSTQEALGLINNWWSQTPWQPYYLHWDDRNEWPDPWQLLDDNFFCGLARALGIMYTICLLERNDLEDAVLIETTQGNLVRVCGEKYILNWDPETIVNITPGSNVAGHAITLQEIQKKLI